MRRVLAGCLPESWGLPVQKHHDLSTSVRLCEALAVVGYRYSGTGQELGFVNRLLRSREPRPACISGRRELTSLLACEIGEKNSKPTGVSQRVSPKVSLAPQDLLNPAAWEISRRATSRKPFAGQGVCCWLGGSWIQFNQINGLQNLSFQELC